MFDYAAIPGNITITFNSIPLIVMSIVALVIAMLILVSGLSVLCVLHKHAPKHNQVTSVEVVPVYDEVHVSEESNLEVTDQIYEDIDATRVDPTSDVLATTNVAYEVTGVDGSSDVPATTNVAYGVTLPQPPENIDDIYYI